MTDLLERIGRLSPEKQRLLQQKLKERSSSKIPPIAPSPLRGTTDRFPCSFSQQRLWFLHQMDPGSAAYNVPSALRLSGPLDLHAFARALTEVARRHEVLRSTFQEGEDGPVQVVAAAAAVPVPEIDLSSLPEDVRAEELERRVAGEARRPFDLARGPVLRAAVLRLGGEDHVLLVSLHHIVSDAWSRGILVRELAAVYGAFHRGEPSPLPELPVQYVDFADWQRRWLQGEMLAAQVEHWRRRLAGAPPLLALPTDRPRPAVQSSRGAFRPFAALPADAARRLEDLSRREGTTLFATLLTAFQVLLCRYSGQEDVIVGFPVAGRRHRETEDLIGFFVNTLVLRADLSGDPPFRSALAAVRETLLDDQGNQDLPFEKLVDELQIERTLSHTPLFQVMLALENAPPEEARLDEFPLTSLDTSTGASKFDLTLVLSWTEEGLAGSLEYSTDLFDTATVDRLLGHFGRLLAGVGADPDRRIWSLPLLPPEERRHLLAELNTGAARRPVAATLPRLFEAQVARRPEAVAVTCEGERLTYRELDALANRWAHRLRDFGVGPEERVGLCVERSIPMVVGVLAILKAGGAYVPLDPAYPEERLRYLLQDSGMRVLLTQGSLRDRLPAHELPAIDLDDLGALGAPGPEGPPVAGTDPDNLAYIIYTSGSTGRPKGVGVTHANVARLFSTTEGLFDFGPDDVWTLFHSHAFDFSVWEIWGALLYGGTLVVVPYWVSRSPSAFRELLVRERVTVLNQTPSAFRQLIEADEAAGGEGIVLRYVVFGGEALDLQSLRPWLARHGDRRPRLVNMYGITETTVHVTWRPLDADDVERGAGSVIGIALPDLSLAVVDRNQEPAPIGVPGEMVVGGAGVARGYLGRPELTAQRFVPDPFGREPGGRLYRSGDLARYLAGGDLEYLGRIDHQVKIRGFRIELGEIEAALGEHPAVRQVIVLARDEGGGDRRLIAYLVTGTDPLPGIEEVRSFLRRRLPEHMIPAAFVPLTAFPLTAHGKIDRAALPAPDRERPDLAGDFVPPRTPEEKELAGIWAEVLKLDRVSADDNFFALGGDSILSIRVRSLAAARGLVFDLQDLFRHQTLSELAAALRSAAEPEEAPLEPFALVAPADRRRLPEGIEDAYPLSFLQLGMLFHSEAGEGPAPYHNVSRFVLRGPFDPAALAVALEGLAARHPVLRTSFDRASFSEPLQLIHREARIPLDVSDERSMDGRFAMELRRRFDWTQPPLVRFWASVLTEDTFELGVTEHHAIVDGWSFATMLTELFALYFAALDRTRPPQAPPAASFRDFVALERRALESEESRRFWWDRLEDLPAFELPRWPVRPPVPERRVETVDVPLDPDLLGRLERLADEAGVPFKSVLLTAHLRVLELLGGPDVVTGLVTHGRPETEDGERVLGLFLNTVPLRVRLEESSWTGLVRSVFAAERELMPHRRFPLAEMQRMRGGQRLFEVAFNYVHFHVLQGTAGRLELLSLEAVAETDFTLVVNCSRDLDGRGVLISLEYDAGELHRAQAAALAESYGRTLRAMAGDPEGLWTTALPLTVEQRHQLLVEWSDTRDHPLGDLPVHRLIEARAAAAPEAPAVVSAEGCLTHGELHRRAAVLARCLRAFGVGPESRVAVAMEHSAARVAALLAVLKAGGAFVSLDPGDPPERRKLLLEDCGARLLFVDEEWDREGVPGSVEAWTVRGALDRGGPEGGDRPVGLDHLAYVIYTSGSTGRPKGVEIPHRGLLNLVRWHLRAYGVTPADRATQLAGPGFDASVWELWPILAVGAAVAIPPAEIRADPARLGPWLAEQGVTISFLPTPVAEMALEEGRFQSSPLRVLLVGGDRLHQGPPPGLPFAVVNHYGPTEGSVVATAGAAGLGEPMPPIGRPIANTRAYVVGPALWPVPAGVRGELWIGGDGLARGYLGKPDLTAERFVPDPFGGEPGARLYRTGDAVRWLPDGRLDFLGRVDQQVKVRGVRVELGEVEAAIGRWAGVREVVASVREDAAGERRLVAWVAPDPGNPQAAEELRSFLRRTLPEAMVPSAVVFLDAMPLTPNGKVDRRALPEPGLAEGRGLRAAPPRDELELELAAVWEEVLGCPVGIDEGFFALGGHSLLAIRLLGRIEQRFGQRLPLSGLLEHPTVAQLARLLRRSGPLVRSPLVPIQPRGVRPPFLCVHPVGGNVLCYVELARHLGPDQPFYGIQAPDPRMSPPKDITDLAASYVEAVKEVQPAGPYRLGGWSLGGVVAFEMARQLAAAGEEVALLAMLDVAAPEEGAADLDPATELACFLDDLRGLTGLGQPPDLSHLRSLAGIVAPEELLEREDIRAALPPDVGAEQAWELFELFRRNLRALHAYRPTPYSGRITLIRSEESSEDSDAASRWAALAGLGAEIHTVPGDHYSMLRSPSVQVLAERLATCIGAAEG